MDLKKSITIGELMDFLGNVKQVIGLEINDITSVNELHKVKNGSLTFVDVKKYFQRVLFSPATVILVPEVMDCPAGKTLLVVSNPFECYTRLAKHIRPFFPISSQISTGAVIGENTVIEPNVVIADGVTIGKNCLIRANVSILEHTHIGDNVIINPNTCIGSDAFYYKKNSQGVYDRWHSIGRVVIRDNVEIGASCTIDKGVSGDTCIGEGTKIDNMVHVAHGVVIGKNCLIAAQVGIAGKTHIQDNVILYGQVGVSKSIVIGENAVVMAQSGVSKSLQGGRTYFGSPAGEFRIRFKEIAAIRRLPTVLAEWEKQQGLRSSEPDLVEMIGNDLSDLEEE